MTCAVCATTIEKKIHELDGVYFAEVNLTTEVLKLEYDEFKTLFMTKKKKKKLR